VPFEVAADDTAARGAAIGRWVSLVLAVVLLAVLVYLVIVGWVGSAQLAEPYQPSADCRTPSALGWSYEAINYPASTDDELAGLPDPTSCSRQGAPAGDALMSSDGVALAGWYIPAGIGPSGPTVVLAHAHGANKSAMLDIAALLHDDYNLVLFDFRNHGQSGGSTTTAGALEQHDLRAVIDWLEAAKAPSSIAVLGVSMGGSAAAREAMTDSRVGALVLDSTHATLANALQARLDRAGMPLSLPAAWSILMGGLVRTGQDMSAVDPVQTIERLGERPLLIIAGEADDAVGTNDASDLLTAAQGGGADAELQVCAGGGHAAASTTCRDAYREWVLGFLRRALASAD
jgi:hypothetical protein